MDSCRALARFKLLTRGCESHVAVAIRTTITFQRWLGCWSRHCWVWTFGCRVSVSLGHQCVDFGACGLMSHHGPSLIEPCQSFRHAGSDHDFLHWQFLSLCKLECNLDGSDTRRNALVIPQDAATEAAFVKRRRAEVTASLAEGQSSMTAAEAEVTRRQAARCAWTAQHSAEADFNETKLVMKKVDAFLNGSLLQVEVSEELQGMAEEMLHHRSKALQELERRDAKIAGKLAKHDGETLVRGKSVFLEAGFGEAQALRQACAGLGCALVEDPCHASAWVAKDPANPGQHVRWVSCLLGGGCCQQRLYHIHGDQGCVLPVLSCRAAVEAIGVRNGWLP